MIIYMRYKSELYKKEQTDLSFQIIDILGLDIDNQITLYALDNDINKQNQIMNMLPELRKYFAFKNMCGIESPEKLKRPWLSIIKHVTKVTHVCKSKEKMLTINKKLINTRVYTFIRNHDL